MADRHDFVADPFTQNLIRQKIRQLLARPEFAPHEGEDLRQELLLHLWKRRHLFDPARGSPEAFATTVTNSWAAMEVRQRRREKRRPDYIKTSLDTRVHTDAGRTASLGELLGPDVLSRRTLRDGIDPFAAVDDADEAAAILDGLPAADRELIEHVARYGISGTARLWSRTSDRPVTRHRVRVMLARAVAHLPDSQIF